MKRSDSDAKPVPVAAKTPSDPRSRVGGAARPAGSVPAPVAISSEHAAEEDDDFGERTVAHDAFSMSSPPRGLEPLAPRPAPHPEMSDDALDGMDPFGSMPTMANLAFMKELPGRIDLGPATPRRQSSAVSFSGEDVIFTSSLPDEPVIVDDPRASRAQDAAAQAHRREVPVAPPPRPVVSRSSPSPVEDMPEAGPGAAPAAVLGLPGTSASELAARGPKAAPAAIQTDGALLDALAAAAAAAPADGRASAEKPAASQPPADTTPKGALGKPPLPRGKDSALSVDPYVAPGGLASSASSAPTGVGSKSSFTKPEPSEQRPVPPRRDGPPRRPQRAAATEEKKSSMPWIVAALAVVIAIVVVVRPGGSDARGQAGASARGPLSELEIRQKEIVARAAGAASPTDAVIMYSEAIVLSPSTLTARDAFLGRARAYINAGEFVRAEQDLAYLRRRGDFGAVETEVSALMRDLENVRAAGPAPR